MLASDSKITFSREHKRQKRITLSPKTRQISFMYFVVYLVAYYDALNPFLYALSRKSNLMLSRSIGQIWLRTIINGNVNKYVVKLICKWYVSMTGHIYHKDNPLPMKMASLKMLNSE